MEQVNSPIWTNVSLGASVTSNPIPLQQEYMVAIQATWTGSPAGNFTLETSCDEGQILPDGTVTGLNNWATYTGSTQAAGGGTGSFVWRISPIPDYWVRLVYTRSSSTGSVTARFNAKG